MTASANAHAAEPRAGSAPGLPPALLAVEPYALARAEKSAILLPALRALTDHHARQCAPYRHVLGVLRSDLLAVESIADIPFIPVRLFKDYELRSVPTASVVKTMTSSGTTGQAVSRIVLDRETAANQQKVLVRLVSSFIGTKRMPMLVIDSPTVLKDRNLFSARGAGILGFSMFGSEVAYALDEHMALNLPSLLAFAGRHAGTPVLLFGFTFIIWEHFRQALQAAGVRLALDAGVMIHGGGWKKLTELAVDAATFRQGIAEVTGIGRVSSYYGMVEQTGSVFIECEAGHLHASVFSDILIRDHRDFSVVANGDEGLVQLLSVLPGSYPGHSILTEDLGRILGEDDCACGRLGKYVAILGRVKNAEVRGCSDAYAARD